MSPVQVMESGAPPVSSKYGNFGQRGFRQVAHPSRMLAMIAGESGVGKTTMFLGHPGALICNFDLHSVPLSSSKMPAPLCSFWPVIDSNGQVLDENMNPMLLNMDAVDALFDRLKEAAKRNLPRPETIVLDSMAPTLLMKKSQYAAKHGYKTFEDMPDGWGTGGRSTGWGKIYDGYATALLELKQMGYGIWLTAQLQTEFIEEDNKTTVVVRHNMPDKVYLRIGPMLEFFGVIELRQESVNEIDPKTGKVLYGTGGKVFNRYLGTMADKVTRKEHARARVALPERWLIPSDPLRIWPEFCDLYMKAAGAADPSS